MCGLFLYDYEHFDPEFSDARVHSPDGICLLCPNHHRRAGRPVFSKEQVAAAYANPRALQDGFAHDNEFALLEYPLHVHLGQITFVNPGPMLVYEGQTVLGFGRGENGRPTFTGQCFGRDGEVLLKIINNEWRGPVHNWDIEQAGSKLTLRYSLGDLALVVHALSPHELRFTHVDMNIFGARVISQPNRNAQIIGAGPTGARVDLPSLNFGGSLGFDRRGNLKVLGGSALG